MDLGFSWLVARGSLLVFGFWYLVFRGSWSAALSKYTVIRESIPIDGTQLGYFNDELLLDVNPQTSGALSMFLDATGTATLKLTFFVDRSFSEQERVHRMASNSWSNPFGRMNPLIDALSESSSKCTDASECNCPNAKLQCGKVKSWAPEIAKPIHTAFCDYSHSWVDCVNGR